MDSVHYVGYLHNNILSLRSILHFLILKYIKKGNLEVFSFIHLIACLHFQYAD